MDTKTFRDNLFLMNTSRFGKVMEILVKRLLKADDRQGKHYDLLFMGEKVERIEVKFSRVVKAHGQKLTEDNVLNVVEQESAAVRMFPYGEWPNNKFKANIQQVKPNEFDVLVYGLLFADRIVIFIIGPDEIVEDKELQYIDKQHKGNSGEGQFHISAANLLHHLKNYFHVTLSYFDAMLLLHEKAVKI